MSGGQQVTVGQGSLVYRPFRPGIEVQQGFLVPLGENVIVAITGEEAEFQSGSINVAAPALTSQEITSGIGTLTASGGVIVLTGSEIIVSAGLVAANLEADDTYIQVQQGFVVRGQDAALTGSEITTGQGTIEYSLYFLTGSEITVSQGSLANNIQAIRLVGAEIVSGQGDVALSGDAELFLTGSEISVQQGIVYTDDMTIPSQATGSSGGRSYRFIGAYDHETCEEEREDLEKERKKVEKEIAALEKQIDEKQDRIEYEDNMRMLTKLIASLNDLQKRLDALQTRLLEIEAEEMALLSVVCEEID